MLSWTSNPRLKTDAETVRLTGSLIGYGLPAHHSATIMVYVRSLTLAIAPCVFLFFSGCISLASIGHSGPYLVDTSHKADTVLSAYRLSDENIVIFIRGRLTEAQGLADFSLLVPRAALAKFKERRRYLHSDVAFFYNATIGPPSDFKLDDWTPVKVQTYAETVDKYAIRAQTEPVVHVLPRGPSDGRAEELRRLWGTVEIVYIEADPDGTAFRCTISPKAERVEKTWNGLMWLPVTVPLDIATMPAQALWGALFLSTAATQ